MLVIKLLAAFEDWKVQRAEKAYLTAQAVITAQQARVAAARADASKLRQNRLQARSNRSNAMVGFAAEAQRLARTFPNG